MSVLLSLLRTLRTWVRSRSALQLEVFALRHQLQVLQRTRPRRVRLADDGPVALGPVHAPLDRMANGARHRQAGDRHRLAPTGLPAVVDLEKPAPHRATDRAGGHPHADPHDGGGEPAVGRAADSWRTTETRDRRLSGDRREIHGPTAPAAFADLAHVLAESHRPDRGGRFLRGPDGDLPPACSSWCSSPTIGDAFGTWRLPRIRRRHGRPNNCARPFRGTRRRDS